MNETLKAVVIELTDDNVRNREIYLRGALGLFPDDCFGSNGRACATPITLRIGQETVKTDIDEEKGIFRDCSAIKRFFEEEAVSEGDLIVIERVQPREFRLWKTSKRGFRYYL
ncbi:MAG TPA: hypothetical protein VGM17_10900 [Rhizomicrobium sp.]|jgi:hypothetical protein